MSLPPPVEALWSDLQSVRAEIMKEIEGLTAEQAAWRPRDDDWSIGEILHHLTLAEVATGKLTSKLLKESVGSAGPFPADLRAFAPLPRFGGGPREAPPAVRPERGHALGELVAALTAARDRSRDSVERLAGVDPRPLRWRHPLLGDMDLAQWWVLQAHHDADHLQQLRAVKAEPGFPRA
jgi:hypothetical protein